MAGLFGKPRMPKVEDPVPMPDEAQTTAARRRLVAKETAGTGVGATILSGTSTKETLGA